jgi:hypothetical protein
MMQDVHVKFNPGLPLRMQQSKKGDYFHQQTGNKLKEELLSATFGAQLCIVLKLGQLGR